MVECICICVCVRIISCRARSLEASPRKKNSIFFLSLFLSLVAVVFASSVHPLVCVSCCVRLPLSHYYLVSFSSSSLFQLPLTPPNSLVSVCAADHFLWLRPSVTFRLAPRVLSFIPHSHLFFLHQLVVSSLAVSHLLPLSLFYKTFILVTFDYDHLKTNSKKFKIGINKCNCYVSGLFSTDRPSQTRGKCAKRGYIFIF